MRAHKRNPYWGEGMDKRQARRFRRRVAQGRPTYKNGHLFLIDELALRWERDLKPLYDLMPERIFLGAGSTEGDHEWKRVSMTENENLSAQSPALAEAVFGPQPPELSEDDFDHRYKPRDSPEGSVLWEREQILPLMDAGEITDNNVWSVVDTDDGGTAAIAGWHVVDVFAYMVTQVPWIDGREGMVFDPLDGEDVEVEEDVTL